VVRQLGLLLMVDLADVGMGGRWGGGSWSVTCTGGHGLSSVAEKIR
jgi:hypothetical protein